MNKQLIHIGPIKKAVLQTQFYSMQKKKNALSLGDIPGRLTAGSGSNVFLRNSVRVCRFASFSSMLTTNNKNKTNS